MSMISAVAGMASLGQTILTRLATTSACKVSNPLVRTVLVAMPGGNCTAVVTQVSAGSGGGVWPCAGSQKSRRPRRARFGTTFMELPGAKARGSFFHFIFSVAGYFAAQTGGQDGAGQHPDGKKRKIH